MKQEKYTDESFDIYLRKITENDTDNIIKWRNNEEVRRYFIYQEPFTRKSHMHWLETKIKSGEAVQFIIVEKNTEVPIGSVYLSHIDYTFKKAEWGIFIGESSCRGKGYGNQAARLVIKYAFDEMHLHRIYARAYADNERAINNNIKAGLVLEGVLRDDVYVNGQYRDIAWLAIINKEEKG